MSNQSRGASIETIEGSDICFDRLLPRVLYDARRARCRIEIARDHDARRLDPQMRSEIASLPRIHDNNQIRITDAGWHQRTGTETRQVQSPRCAHRKGKWRHSTPGTDKPSRRNPERGQITLEHCFQIRTAADVAVTNNENGFGRLESGQ